MMAGGHAGEAVVGGSVDDADGGEDKKERSGQLHGRSSSCGT